MNVSFNEDPFNAAVRQAVEARLAQLANGGQPTHENSDGNFSPAEWWADEERTERHTMQTTASLSVSGLTVKVTLNYSVSVA